MLEFCQTVSPNLDDYEADGVSSPLHVVLNLIDFTFRVVPGMANALGRLRRVEKG